MKHSLRFFTLLMCLVSYAVQADDHNMDQQLAEVNAKIEQERVVNAELKERLAARETEMNELKSKLKVIEDQIAALKTEYNL